MRGRLTVVGWPLPYIPQIGLSKVTYRLNLTGTWIHLSFLCSLGEKTLFEDVMMCLGERCLPPIHLAPIQLGPGRGEGILSNRIYHEGASPLPLSPTRFFSNPRCAGLNFASFTKRQGIFPGRHSRRPW